MLEALGVVVTEKAIGKVSQYTAGVLYKRMVTQAPDGIVLAIKAQAALAKALPKFALSPDTMDQYMHWQEAELAAASHRATIEKATALASAALAEDGMDLDVASIMVDVPTDSIRNAVEHKAGWMNALYADWQACVTANVTDPAVRDYVLNNTRGVRGDEDTGALDKSEIAVPIPTKATRRAGTRKAASGNGGTRGKWLLPSQIRIDGKTITCGTAWGDIAKALQAEGIIGASSTAYNYPAQRQLCNALKGTDAVFVYLGVGEFTPMQVLNDEGVRDRIQRA